MEDNFDLNDWEALSEGSRRNGSDNPLWELLLIFIVLVVIIVLIS